MTKELHFKLKELAEVAQTILKNAQSKTLLFYGEMGTGKTTLISAMVKAMGGTDSASSPTFSIVNEYKVTEDTVYHFDFYRLKNQYEALDMGIEDYFCSGAWNFIEWPEKIENLLPDHLLKIHIETDSNKRIFTIEESNFVL